MERLITVFLLLSLVFRHQSGPCGQCAYRRRRECIFCRVHQSRHDRSRRVGIERPRGAQAGNPA